MIIDGILPFDELFFADINDDGQPDLLLSRYFGGLSYYENRGNISFSLQQENALGISDNPLRRQRSIWLEGERLVTANAEGQIVAYKDVREALINQTEISPELLPFFDTENRMQSPYLGNPLFPARYGDFLLLGTAAGGVMLFEESEITALEENELEEVHTVQVYPNPNMGIFQVEFPEAGKLLITDTMGREYYEASFEAGVRNLSIKLPRGMYVLRFYGKDNVFEAVRFIVE